MCLCINRFLYFLFYTDREIIEPSPNLINNTVFDSGLNYFLLYFLLILPILINPYVCISFLICTYKYLLSSLEVSPSDYEIFVASFGKRVF